MKWTEIDNFVTPPEGAWCWFCNVEDAIPIIHIGFHYSQGIFKRFLDTKSSFKATHYILIKEPALPKWTKE